MVYFQTLSLRAERPSRFRPFHGTRTAHCRECDAGSSRRGQRRCECFSELYVALYEAAAANDLERVKALQHHVMAVAASLYTIGRYGSSAIKGNQVRTFAHGDMQRLPFISLPAIPRCRTDEGAGRARKTAGADPDLTPAMSWQE